jgi:transcriptional antiterminator
MLYLSRKKSVGAPDGNQNRNIQLCNSCTIDNKETTAEAVAKETGVSPRTIANDAAYAEAAS